jgi:prepilin-type N-terminal cleavage/methylation domain-containing protein
MSLTDKSKVRSGYTLLEVVVAMAIAVMLMAALYVSMNILIGSQRSGRAIAEQSATVRALLARMDRDIASQLPPIDPRVNPIASYMITGVQPNSGNGGAGAGGGTGSGTGAGGTAGAGKTGSGTSGAGSMGGSTGSGSSNSSSSSSSNNNVSIVNGTGVGNNGPVVFNLGVQGTPTQLTLYTSMVPGEALRYITSNNNSQAVPITSDLRRITYWLAGDANSPLGLARQEIKVATSQDALSPFDPSQLDEKSYVVAEEVIGLQFQYFDGTQWQDGWDGTQVQQDGQTPLGPPLAIAITLTVRRSTGSGGTTTTSYRHVVAIPTANNIANNLLNLSTSQGGPSSSGSNSASSGSGSSTTGGTSP